LLNKFTAGSPNIRVCEIDNEGGQSGRPNFKKGENMSFIPTSISGA